MQVPLDARCNGDDALRQAELLEEEKLGEPGAKTLSQLGEDSQRSPRPLPIAIRGYISTAHPVGPAANDEGWQDAARGP